MNYGYTPVGWVEYCRLLPGQVRSFKNFLEKWWASDRTRLLVTTAIITPGEKPVMATPRAVPLAGGCSKSSATMRQIEIPTARAKTLMDVRVEGCGMSAHNEPEKRPTRCPPITLLGLAVTLFFATIIEVCSEGSAPLAFEIYNQSGAFGNSFTFLMAGVATDYTEIGLIWHNIGKRAALWLPILTVPQVLAFGILFNLFL